MMRGRRRWLRELRRFRIARRRQRERSWWWMPLEAGGKEIGEVEMGDGEDVHLVLMLVLIIWRKIGLCKAEPKDSAKLREINYTIVATVTNDVGGLTGGYVGFRWNTKWVPLCLFVGLLFGWVMGHAGWLECGR
ncbi:MAG: hypothetical protein ACRYGG_23945 [Janthinobacterium lividum]